MYLTLNEYINSNKIENIIKNDQEILAFIKQYKYISRNGSKLDLN